MIIYKNSAGQFRNEVDMNLIADQIVNRYETVYGRRAHHAEVRAWNNSMRYMETVLRRSGVPDDCGVLIEYNIPSTSKRIDFVITGRDEEDQDNFVIVELKQWETAEATTKEDVVRSFVGGAMRDVTHPSYQAQSYLNYMSDMNEAVYDGNIRMSACAYLHNYSKQDPEPLLSPQYQDILDTSPVFFKNDTDKLQSFIKRYVGQGNGLGILFEIDNGRIAPSKKFVEYVSDLFDGREIYTLLDEQKVAYSSIVDIALHAEEKTTIIINGGPGTGKSVVAMNAFVKLLQSNLNLQFVAPNASFRSTLTDMLASGRGRTKKRLNALFSGSSKFVDAIPNEFDVLICDEAHRLKKRGAYMYRGLSQVEDIIRAAKVSVFFVDDHQMVRPDDEGSTARIRDAAEKFGSRIETVKLEAQFRCSGAEGFMNWVDHTLMLSDTANFDGWDEESFEFKLVDNPNELKSLIDVKAESGAKARLLAGYAWPWTTDKAGNKNAEVSDIVIDEYNFAMPWNSRTQPHTWAVDPDKADQIGCIHTSQGLEFDYVGVIIGYDLRYDPENKTLYSNYQEYYDSTGKKGLKNNPDELNRLIRNIYRVLMSRGMKGCYVYCRDEHLQAYFASRLGRKI